MYHLWGLYLVKGTKRIVCIPGILITRTTELFPVPLGMIDTVIPILSLDSDTSTAVYEAVACRTFLSRLELTSAYL